MSGPEKFGTFGKTKKKVEGGTIDRNVIRASVVEDMLRNKITEPEPGGSPSSSHSDATTVISVERKNQGSKSTPIAAKEGSRPGTPQPQQGSQLGTPQAQQSQPETAQPQQGSQLGNLKPQQSQPETAQPQQGSQLGNLKPQQSQPETAQPQQSQPETAQPQQSQPETAQPQQGSQLGTPQAQQSQPETAQPQQGSQPGTPQPKQSSQPGTPQPQQGSQPGTPGSNATTVISVGRRNQGNKSTPIAAKEGSRPGTPQQRSQPGTPGSKREVTEDRIMEEIAKIDMVQNKMEERREGLKRTLEDYKMDVTQQKLAEKLTILNDRGIGLLTRLYNIKKACGDAKSKPGFLSEKTLESSIKHIVKKFPNMDIRQVSNIAQYRSEINKTLQLYYYTFVDLLDFKDHVSELLTIMDACQVELDITLNYDLTKGYLDLVVTYVILMILLSRVEDRKAVLGLFHVAQEMANNPTDNNFPRLGQMILEYDPPMKRLSEEFGPHSRLLVKALQSLQNIYPRRNLEADTFRKKQMLSLTAQPGYLLIPARTDTTPCEFLSLDIMERWIIFGFMLCHQVSMSQFKGSSDNNSSDDMWLSALRSSWVITLFRDEVLYIHQYIVAFFDGIKGYGKRISEVKDALTYAIGNAALMHRERRKFFRTALKEMALVMTDQPGLLGSKALYVFMGLCYARDEVVWLIRHYDNPPLPRSTSSIKIQNKNKVTEDLTDRQLPELLFHMEELRALVRKYSQVIQRYYVQYLSCYDGPALGQLLPNYIKMETEYMILNSIYNTISSLSVKQVEDNEVFDFRGVRLDWYRLQSFMSHVLGRNQGLSYLMNTTTFHLKLVDFQDELLSETSDLSVLCFYNRIFEEQFHMCLEFPAQNRYIVAFPLICSHFQNCTHEMCPEERHHIRERSLSVVNMFLDEMAKEAKNIITTICDEQCTLQDKLLPKHCAALIAHHLHRKKGKDKNKKTISEIEINKPGVESFRKTREDLTTMDKLHMALTELCYAINYCPSISVWEYTFAPKEYLHQHLENRFARALVGMVMYSAETNEIAKPSELLASVRAYMNVLQTVENYVHLDMTRVFNNVLLQQTQQQDTHGEKTVAFLYTQWYTEVLLRRVSNGNIIFSTSQRAFVNLTPDPSVPFSAEEFSDITELRALAELIGPYGMKHLNEAVMFQVASQLQELKKLTAANREVLMLLRTNFDKPEIMKDLCKKLQNAENVLLRMTIIGMVLRFRQISQEALHDVLVDRIPFLLSSILDFHEHSSNGESINVAEMASAAGISLKVDPTLVHVLQQNQKADAREEEYQLSCLLMVFVAVSIPRLARIDASVYRASLEGHSNNIHSLATAINTVFGALFSMSGASDVEERLKEFLALASSSLLRLGQEADKETVKNRESVYLLLDMIVQESPFLTMDLLESCFPYALIRNAFHAVYKQENAQIP